MVVVPIIVLVGAGVALFGFDRPIAGAAVGDCAAANRSATTITYVLTRCGSTSATLTVLQVIDGGGNCRDVAGATRAAVATDGDSQRTICLGPIGLDPAAAVNIAQVGDCLAGPAGQQHRVPCTSPDATSKVLKRIEDLSTTEVSTACDRVPDATGVLPLQWEGEDGTGGSASRYQTDVVLCLGAA